MNDEPRLAVALAARAALLLVLGCARPEALGSWPSSATTRPRSNGHADRPSHRRRRHRTLASCDAPALGSGPGAGRRHHQLADGHRHPRRAARQPADPPHRGLHRPSNVVHARGTAGGTRAFAWRKQYVETVPWNAFVYATPGNCLLDAAAPPAWTRPMPESGSTSSKGWEEGHVGYADVVRRRRWRIRDPAARDSRARASRTWTRTAAWRRTRGKARPTSRKCGASPACPISTPSRPGSRPTRRPPAAGHSLSPRDTVRATLGTATADHRLQPARAAAAEHSSATCCRTTRSGGPAPTRRRNWRHVGADRTGRREAARRHLHALHDAGPARASRSSSTASPASGARTTRLPATVSQAAHDGGFPTGDGGAVHHSHRCGTVDHGVGQLSVERFADRALALGRRPEPGR